MRIAYLMRHDISKNDGVTKKILDQVTYWKNAGHQVEVFCYTPKKCHSILDANQYPIRTPLKNKFLLETNLLSDLSIFNPDVVYYRYSTLNRTLWKILKKYKIVTEVNTDDMNESKMLLYKEKNLKSFARYITFKLFRSKILSSTLGIITVTNEIAQLPTIQKFQKPTKCIPNSINLSNYFPLKDSSPCVEKVGLFFMGSPNQAWHGVDIIVNLALELPQYDFHIVGMTGENTHNLFWYGYLEKDEYLHILSKCHICIGTLALMRKQMKEACPLKVREYLAYGYPTIIGYEDVSFINRDASYILKLDSSLPNLTFIQDICNFVEQYKEYTVPKSLIQHIDIKITEDKRLEFIQNCIDYECKI